MPEDQNPGTDPVDDDNDTGRSPGTDPADDDDDDDSGDKTGGDDSDVAELRKVMADLRLTPNQIASRLKSAKDWEKRARSNNAKSQSVEQQLTELRNQLAERDTAYVERNGRLAMEKVRSGIASKDVNPDDVADVLAVVDPVAVLLKDGEPDETAISKLVDSLAKVGGRVRPDPDQGKKGATGPISMDTLIRRARGLQI
jgi:hypothetical protein